MADDYNEWLENYGDGRQKRRAALMTVCDERRTRRRGKKSSRDRPVRKSDKRRRVLGKNEENF